MVDKEILKKKDSIIELCNKYSILYFSVFGSRATNSFNKNSDYDFAYYARKRLSKEDKSELLAKLELLFPKNPIDLIELNTVGNPILSNEIFTKGYLIYSKSDEILSELEFNSWADYQDIQHFIEDAKKDFKMN